MTMQRAYSTLTIKAVTQDGGRRTFSGVASTPSVDRMGDIVDPKGAQFTLPIPLLYQHDSHSPIGQITSAKVTSKGIDIEGYVETLDGPPTLKERLDVAWAEIKAGLVRGLSIGFSPIETESIDPKKPWAGQRFTLWDWLELSAVTIPANAEASIQTVKSIDTKQLAASGKKAIRVVRLDKPPPGVTGKTTEKPATERVFLRPKEGKMNVQEQIKSYGDQRATKAAALNDLMEKAGTEGATLDAEQSEQYDTLEQEVASLDTHLKRLRTTQTLLGSKAVPVTPSQNADDAQNDASKQRGDSIVIPLEKKLDKGIAFSRFVKFMAMNNGNAREALDMAKDTYPNEAPLHNVLKMHIGQGQSRQFIEKTAVAGALTSTSTWAGALVQYQNMASDFIEFLRPQTIIGQLPGLRRVPFKVRVPRQTGGGSASWVGEGKAKPLTSFAFDTVTLDFTKIASIAVLNDEVVRLSAPSAETIVRDQLAAAIIQQMDSDFIDPANSGSGVIKPASITNGATTAVATGTTTQAGIASDVLTLFGGWINANETPATGAWIMSPTTAMALGLMTNSLGNQVFPGMSINGGTFAGLPVVVSQSAGLVGASDGAHIVVLLRQSDILLADDGVVAVDASRETALEMSDAPSSSAATGTGASLVSMFQTNSVAIRAERWINWVKARSTAVSYLTAVHWGGFPV